MKENAIIINPSDQTEREEQREKAFQLYPKNFALSLVKRGTISYDELVLVLLRAMSDEDVRQALDANELSPRFI
tara:strand:+ start:80 stop:301 length:222 start_codon:yes stop_codon:yes gene_type:complete